ncbi:CheR family methyltransferase [Enterobacter cloacae]|uniref:Chemotaxis protein methyltransferase n=2 Tax=Enterobacter cloacae TaxID=550 RepID=A0AAW6NVK2_ENTCL|nr:MULTISPECIES: CheR family methyltransferase [Enterobacter]AIV30513.1 chemotaxis protein CheR [Enterobacter cloacae]EKD5159301.1 methyltransferase domain-containing protein [Enterobacter cloacae]EKM5718098.1 methyltransferase domain-containing protein [Enterobacter cloacae]EKP1125436.1 methyltransferase domain-containing protein [Enterobacter cloacae]EKT9189823.1 methyltransferase domain-containing protein [Enterobacter cloacae]
MSEIISTSARLSLNTLSLTDSELQRVGKLIYKRAGIVVNAQKREMIFNRLSRRVRTLGLATFSDYIALLESHSEHPEWQNFINALTTNLTSFFREAYHFPILAEHARQRANGYRVWCTAASTGEEPCSIAMTLNDQLGASVAGPRIWASDIDTEVLAKAEAGIYRLSDLDALTLAQKRHYFLRGAGDNSEWVKARQELLSAIHYQQLNLLDEKWSVPGPFDAIFCRNVMIYFDAPTQQRLLQRFARLLKPGGLLFVGHSEHFNHAHIPLRLRGQSVYELTEATR